MSQLIEKDLEKLIVPASNHDLAVAYLAPTIGDDAWMCRTPATAISRTTNED